MKKVFYSFAVAALALAASCTREVAPAGLVEGIPAEVTFTLRTGLQTKAVNDGSQANKLRVAVVDVTDATNPVLIDDASYITEAIDRSGDGSFTYTATLLKGQSYRFVFWADKDLAYDFAATATTATVSAKDYAAAAANDEGRDAFKLVVTKTMTADGIDENLVLTRAVAQINLAASDYAKAQQLSSSFAFAGSEMTVSAPGSLNLLTGEAGSNVDYAFTGTTAVDGTFTLPNDNTAYHWEAANYVLAGAQANYTVSVKVKASLNGTEKEFISATLDNVPLAQNYRTNLVGAFYTADVQFNITIDADINEITPAIEVVETAASDVTAVNAALLENANDETMSNYTIDEVKTDNTTIEIPYGYASGTLNFTINSFEIPATGGDPVLTIQDVAGSNAPYSGDVTIKLPADANVDLVTVNLPLAHVTITNGTATKVVATTAGETLVVGADAYVKELEVKAGNVLVIGKVDKITRAEGNSATVIVYLDEAYTGTKDDITLGEGVEFYEEEEPSEEPTYDFTTIAELNALLTAESVEYNGTLTGAVVSFVNGNNAIIKDETGSILYYKKSHGLLQGQTYSGEITVSAQIYNSNYTELTAISATFEGEGAVVEPEVLTLAQLTADGAYAKYQNAYAKIEGVTSQTTTTAKGNINVTDGTNQYVIYTNVAIPVNDGDVLTAVGTITKYGETEELKVWTADDLTITPSEASEDPSTDPSQDASADPEEVIVATVAEFLAAEVFTDYTKAQKYQLTGTISNITNTKYGNFNLTDETGTVYVYGLTATEQGLKSNTAANNDQSFASLGLKAGDVLTLIGYRYLYSGSNTDQVLGGYYVSHVAGDAITELSFKANASVEVGSELDIHATVSPSEATIVYASQDESIVTISQDGVIKGIAAGQATVTATVQAVSGSYTAAEKTCVVTVVTPSSGGGDAAPAGTVLWSETWTGGASGDTPASYSQSGTTVYNNANVTYTFTESSSQTKLYIDTQMNGSDSQENMLIAKTSGSWTVDGIPTGGASKLLLKFYVNNNSGIATKCAVSSTTVTLGDQTPGNEEAKPFSVMYEIIPGSVDVFDLTFSNTNSSNVRIDDISVTVVE